MEVVLNVYNLPDQQTTNARLQGIGLGLFHSGVQVCDMEYSFSMSGVQRTRPLLPEFGTIRQQISLGSYTGTREQLADVIQTLSTQDFSRGSYDMLSRNCNDFSNALCQRLLNVSIPDWVNRAARIGRNVLPDGVARATNQSPSSAASDEVFAMPGVVKAPTLPVKVVGNPLSGPNPFSNNNTVKDPTEGGIGSFFTWLFGRQQSSFSSDNLAGTGNDTPVAAKSDPTQRKQLTEKQKSALAKVRGGQK